MKTLFTSITENYIDNYGKKNYKNIVYVTLLKCYFDSIIVSMFSNLLS